MLYDSYIDSERYGFVHPRAWATGGVGGIYIRAATHTGFLVATNIKIRQGVRYESTKCYRYYELTFSRPESNT